MTLHLTLVLHSFKPAFGYVKSLSGAVWRRSMAGGYALGILYWISLFIVFA
jgi:hypothetical protein